MFLDRNVGEVAFLYYEPKKKHLRKQVLFSMKRTLRCMKNEAELRSMKRGFATKKS
jgi:hypothetical protein